MNRNNERHFNSIPKITMSRTTFNRDQKIMTTFDAGELIPFYVDEVLPGDTFRVSTSAIIRQTTPKYPVMDDAYIDLYYFFAPDRIEWKDFKAFMGEAEDQPWMPGMEYSMPQIKVNGPTAKEEAYPKTGSILDYMGIPTHVVTAEKAEAGMTFNVNALPIRAYVHIWNEFFRDQNVGNQATWRNTQTDVTYKDSGSDDFVTRLREAYTGGRCLPVNKFHDYFTSCLPYPQRGPEVTIPMTGNAPIRSFTDEELTDRYLKSTASSFTLSSVGTATANARTNLTGDMLALTPDKETLRLYGQGGGTNRAVYMGADLSAVTAATINDLRQAVAVQQYYEAMARGGSRYREQIRSIWGTTISDKTVQIPEYLGGGRYHVNMNQIVQTSGESSTDGTPLGETGAISVTPINEASFTKSFEEHGFVIGVMCVRHDRTYQQGLERFWSRKDRLDYYVPQFAHLGEQPVKKKEIMLTGTSTDEETFGYQEAWSDYRMKPNRVSGKMRSNAEGTLDFWHYADDYATVPTLSQGWMAEGKAEIARTLIVQDEPQFFGALLVKNKTTRCMPLYSVPGLNKL